MKKKIFTIVCFWLILFPAISWADIEIPKEAASLPQADLKDILVNILEWLLRVFGIIGILGFLISGIMYLISAGDDDMASKAKKGMTYSIYGVIVGLSGYVVIQAVDIMLRGWSYF